MKTSIPFLKPAALAGLAVLAACTQKVETSYYNGQVREQFFQKKGKGNEMIRHGEYQAWDQQGNLIAAGTYDQGLPVNGSFTSWHDNGTMALLFSCKDKKRSGEWSMWYSDGRIKEQGAYKSGIKHGQWFALKESGDTLYRGVYAEGKKEGPWLELTYLDTALVHIEEGEYEKDLRTGAWVRWQSLARQSKLAEGKYLQGKKTGPWTVTVVTPEGKPRELITGFYKDDRQDSLWIVKYPWKRLKRKMVYKDGKLHGPYKAWDRNGGTEEEGAYRNGLKHGNWTVYDAARNEFWMEEYRRGRRLSRFKL